MGAVGHRRLINWLTMAIGLQLSVALVAIAVRAGGETPPPAKAQLSAGETRARETQRGSLLAGAPIERRRGTNAGVSPGPTVRPESTTTTAAPAPPTTASPTTAPPVTMAPRTPAPRTQGAPRTTAAPRPRPERRTRGTAKAKEPAPAAAKPAAARAKGQPGAVGDPAGDTVVDGSKAPIGDPRSDIVRAGAAYGPEDVTFTMQVQQPNDPRTDERWAADSTYAQWQVDTNGDSVPDFEVQYYVVDRDNLGGRVTRPDGGDPVCDGQRATYGTDGYTLTVDPACLGNPASLSYRATLYYDTDPADPDAAVATDAAPDGGGWSAPIRRS